MSTIQRDVTGRRYVLADFLKELAPKSSVPVYVLGRAAIGSGALGGVVVDLEDLGQRTGKLAVRVLGGVAPESLPIEVINEGTPMFDWRELQRWHIKESQLPAGSKVLYRPETIWGKHRDLILFLAAVFLAQTLTIAGLIAQRRRRRRAEAEILHHQMRLAHASRVSTLGQLAAALTHELRQPLGAILRNAEAAELFLQKAPPDLDEIRAILDDIRKDDQRAGQVIDRMRSLIKRRELEMKPLDLLALIEETVMLAQTDANNRRVNLTVQLPVRLPDVCGDRVHLQQVLLNLILNALDAMTDCQHGNCAIVIWAGLGKDGSIEVTVSDEGPGIPTKQMAQIFEPFFTTKPNGLGLGLVISKTIIEAHGGKIWAVNNTVSGTTFKFTLPANQIAA